MTLPLQLTHLISQEAILRLRLVLPDGVCGNSRSIVSGTVAERIKLSFLGFVVLLTAFIYPIQASWVWGGGFFAAGFSDCRLTLVHSVGGWPLSSEQFCSAHALENMVLMDQ